MAFWNRAQTRATPTATMDNPPSWMLDAFGATPSSSGQSVSVDKALGLIPLYAAVSLIAEQVATLPFKVYRTGRDGEREEARSHSAWRLLNQKPNSHTPAGRFWSTVAAHLLLYGNAFIEKVGRGSGMELFILPPAEVAVMYYPRLREKTFRWTPSDMSIPGSSVRGGGPVREFDETEVLHIMNLSMDGIVGMSVIDKCRNPLGSALARDVFEGSFYKRGAVMSGIVQMKGSVKNDAALKRLKDSLVALFAGVEKAHGVPVLEEDAVWVPTSSPLRDLQFVESRNMTATDVASLFKLPPNALGGSSGDGLTYATVEMNQQQIGVNAISPLTHTIAEAVTWDPAILPQNILEAEFTLEGMMRGDAKTRSEFYKTLVEIKAMLPEEVRKKENLPPLTAEQKRELKPTPPTPAPPDGAQLPAAVAAINGNGNGNPRSGQ
jgi:HK97 family phage portal protein